jgi:hypothetical protein
MPLMHESFIITRGTSVDSARAAVKSYPRSLVDYHRAVIDMNVCDSDVVDAAVVIEVSAVPVTTLVAFAKITETIINAAVEANVRPPITGMPKIGAAAKCPIAGSP